MANESLFAFATNYAEARAKALGGNIVKGAAAFEVEDAPVRRDLSETQFNIGDKIVIPATADSEQWICTPLTRGILLLVHCVKSLHLTARRVLRSCSSVHS